MYTNFIKEMFTEMVEKKNASLISKFYHPDLQLFTNEETMGYDSFRHSHEKIYQTSIQYQVSYDDETILEQGDKWAGRIWITTTRPGEPSRRIEVILIIKFKENKIHKLWELTYPDWSKLPAFDTFR